MVQVLFTPTAEADLAALTKAVAQRILNRIRWLAENFGVVQPLPLTGQWRGMYKLRVGDYRVLYTFSVDAKVLTIRFVRHRREVYRY